MSMVPDQDPVQALGPHAAHPPFGIRVRPRSPDRGLHDCAVDVAALEPKPAHTWVVLLVDPGGTHLHCLSPRKSGDTPGDEGAPLTSTAAIVSSGVRNRRSTPWRPGPAECQRTCQPNVSSVTLVTDS